MEQIGIRELRQHASKWINTVRAGASIEITYRGQPVAHLVPVNSADAGRDALAAAGLSALAPAPRATFDASTLIADADLTAILDEQRSDR